MQLVKKVIRFTFYGKTIVQGYRKIQNLIFNVTSDLYFDRLLHNFRKFETNQVLAISENEAEMKRKLSILEYLNMSEIILKINRVVEDT